MDFARAIGLQVTEYLPDAILDAAWIALGKYKLSLRKLAYGSKGEVTLAKLRPQLRAANKKIDEIWDEILKRQANPIYYRRLSCGRKAGKPEWDPRWSPLRGLIPPAFPRREFLLSDVGGF